MNKFTTAIFVFLSFVSTAQNTNETKVSVYNIWQKVSMGEFGLGFGSGNETDLTGDKTVYGVHGSMAIGNYAFGFHNLGGLGFGTKVIAYYGMPKVELNSFVPLYAYFPIYISKNKSKPSPFANNYNIPSMLNLYAGGSLWCRNSSIFSEDAILPDKFYHVGINWMFYNYFDNYDIYGNGNFSIDAAMFFYQNKGGSLKNVFKISIIYTGGGFARIKYK